MTKPRKPVRSREQQMISILLGKARYYAYRPNAYRRQVKPETLAEWENLSKLYLECANLIRSTTK